MKLKQYIVVDTEQTNNIGKRSQTMSLKEYTLLYDIIII